LTPPSAPVAGGRHDMTPPRQDTCDGAAGLRLPAADDEG